MRRLIVLLALALSTAVPLAAADAFLKIDSVPGDSTDRAHPGWIEALHFAWAAPDGHTLSATARCGVHGFSIEKRVEKASSSKLAEMVLRDTVVPTAILEVGGERHLLHNLRVGSVQQLPGHEGTRQSVKFAFGRCETHEAAGLPPGYEKGATAVTSNALLSVSGIAGSAPVILEDLHSTGPHDAVIVLRSPAAPAISGLQQAFQARQKLAVVTFTVRRDNLEKSVNFVFHDTTVSNFSPGGSIHVTLNFGQFDGPPSGFHEVSLRQ